MKNKSMSILSIASVAAILIALVSGTAGCGSPAATTATTTATATVTATASTTTVATVTATATATVTAAPSATTTPKPANPDIILATTTSTRDTGLLDVLIPMFQAQTGYNVKTVAVGSGAAIAMGQSGNADVLLVHSPTDELKFMASGAGVNRVLVMHNDFIIVGPAFDPAGIKGMTSAVDAMKKIATVAAIFVSRADASGTNAYELSIWAKLGINPKGQAWYMSTGQAMGATLIVADQKNGYTISDRGTYLAFQKSISSVLMVNGTKVDPTMINAYHVIQVNPSMFAKINADGAKAFSDFMVAPSTQQVIGSFGIITYGQALFTPDAGKTEAELGTQ